MLQNEVRDFRFLNGVTAIPTAVNVEEALLMSVTTDCSSSNTTPVKARSFSAPPDRVPSLPPIDSLEAAKDWCNQLPRIIPLTYVDMMRHGIATLSERPIDNDTLTSILACYRDTFEKHLSVELHLGAKSTTLPLAKRVNEKIRVGRQFCLSIAEAYELAAKRNLLKDDPDSPVEYGVESCYFALHYFGEALRFDFERYQLPAPGIWLDIHRVFNLAAEVDVQQAVMPHTVTQSSYDSIEKLYKSLLLLGLSDHYHLPFGSLETLYTFLPIWSNDARLIERKDHDTGNWFVIDPRRDIPAMPVLPGFNTHDEQHSYYLDTTRIVGTLAKRIKQIQDNISYEHKDTLMDYLDYEELQLDNTLTTQWGERKMRQSRRVAINKPAELVAGIHDVWKIVSDDKFLHHTDGEEIDLSTRTINGTFGQKMFERENSINLSPDWLVLNESATGVRIASHQVRKHTLNVGEVVAFNMSGKQSDWVAGIVRWVRFENQSVEAGVYKLGSDMIPVNLIDDKSRIGPREARPSAIYLPGTAQTNGNPAVVARRGTYSPGELLRFSMDNSMLTFRAGKLISASTSIDLFEVFDDVA